jgi:hypothetical protein
MWDRELLDAKDSVAYVFGTAENVFLASRGNYLETVWELEGFV